MVASFLGLLQYKSCAKAATIVLWQLRKSICAPENLAKVCSVNARICLTEHNFLHFVIILDILFIFLEDREWEIWNLN
jgi:hypothetical protein